MLLFLSDSYHSIIRHISGIVKPLIKPFLEQRSPEDTPLNHSFETLPDLALDNDSLQGGTTEGCMDDLECLDVGIVSSSFNVADHPLSPLPN